MDRYWPLLVTYSARYLGAQDLSEDIVQESFVRVWVHRTELRQSTSPKAYLYRVVRNLVVDELRRRQVRDRWIAKANPVAGPSVATPAHILEANELAQAAARAIAALPAIASHTIAVAADSDHSVRETKPRLPPDRGCLHCRCHCIRSKFQFPA